jgi:hypothetical protein
MKQLIRRSAVLLVACVLAAGLSTAFVPTAGAHADGTVLESKTITVKPSGKKARFQLRLVGERVYLSMSVRRNGAFKQLDRVRLSHRYTDGSSDARLGDFVQYSRNGGQALVSWRGATAAGDYDEYFGWNIKTGDIELYGTGG